MAKWAAARFNLLAAVILAMAAPVAGEWATLGCYVRNRVLCGGPAKLEGVPAVASGALQGSPWLLALYVVFAILALVWIVAVVMFVRQNARDWSRWALAIVPVVVFVVSTIQTYIFAYPVCNAF